MLTAEAAVLEASAESGAINRTPPGLLRSAPSSTAFTVICSLAGPAAPSCDPDSGDVEPRTAASADGFRVPGVGGLPEDRLQRLQLVVQVSSRGVFPLDLSIECTVFSLTESKFNVLDVQASGCHIKETPNGKKLCEFKEGTTPRIRIKFIPSKFSKSVRTALGVHAH